MKPIHMLLAVLLVLTAISFRPAPAEAGSPLADIVTVETGRPFTPFIKALRTEIKGRGFNLIGIACATCAAKSLGVTVPGNRVFLFFKPAYAVRMLAASEAAGLEAPIRLYVTEDAAGTAKVTYRLPSRIFGAYGGAELEALGAELDADVTAIITATKAASGG